MPGRAFAPAKWEGGMPEIQYLLVDSAQTFKAGALVIGTAAGDGEIDECGADPALVLGVALSPAGSALGYNVSNINDVVAFTGRENRVSVAIANNKTTFSGRGVSGGTDPVTPLQTHMQEQYGTAKDADGIWYIDLAETTVKTVQIVGFDVSTKSFLFKFIPAAQVQA